MAGRYETLPFLVGIPHGSLAVPREVLDALRLDEEALRIRADVGLETVLDLPVAARVTASAHRVVCDPDRAPEDLSEHGVVPRLDRDGGFLYREGREPDAASVRERLERFHTPYHLGLTAARQDEDVLFHFEVHAMSEVPPPGAPDRERYDRSDRYRRPQVCLSNHGDAEGRPRGGSFLTCPTEDLASLAALFRGRGYEVVCNNPLETGHAALTHGKRWYAGVERVPVVQLALREDMWLTSTGGTYDPDRGGELRVALRMILEDFADTLTQAEVEIGL